MSYRCDTNDGLLILLLTYCAPSLFHYVHNAMFLDEYPNMPAWLSPARVYAAWLGVTVVTRRNWQELGRTSATR